MLNQPSKCKTITKKAWIKVNDDARGTSNCSTKVNCNAVTTVMHAHL